MAGDGPSYRELLMFQVKAMLALLPPLSEDSNAYGDARGGMDGSAQPTNSDWSRKMCEATCVVNQLKYMREDLAELGSGPLQRLLRHDGGLVGDEQGCLG